MKLNYGTMLLAGLAELWIVWHFRLLPWSISRGTGLVLLLASTVLLAVARIQLGRAFSLRARADTLVTTGIYARIRNPIYCFGVLALAGMALWLAMPRLLLLLLVTIPLQIHRARKEERVLAARFPDAYAEYKRRTWF